MPTADMLLNAYLFGAVVGVVWIGCFWGALTPERTERINNFLRWPVRVAAVGTGCLVGYAATTLPLV